MDLESVLKAARERHNQTGSIFGAYPSSCQLCHLPFAFPHLCSDSRARFRGLAISFSSYRFAPSNLPPFGVVGGRICALRRPSLLNLWGVSCYAGTLLFACSPAAIRAPIVPRLLRRSCYPSNNTTWALQQLYGTVSRRAVLPALSGTQIRAILSILLSQQTFDIFPPRRSQQHTLTTFQNSGSYARDNERRIISR